MPLKPKEIKPPYTISLPNLPDDVLESVEDIINKPRSNSIVKQDYFQARPISNELQDAIYHIERNGNSKIILTDLSIKLTRLLHKKPE